MRKFVALKKYWGSSGGYEVKTHLGIEARIHFGGIIQARTSAERIAKHYGLAQYRDESEWNKYKMVDVRG